MFQTAALYRSFLKEHVPSLQRIGRGHLSLMALLVETRCRGGEDIFIPAVEMQDLTRDYAPIRDAVCIMKGYHNRDEALCDRIVGWTPQFNDLITSVLKEENRAIRLYRQTYKTILSIVIKETTVDRPYPGADESSYTISPAGARLYHTDQGLTKEMRRIKFAGFVDFDIDACFPNIFRRLLEERGMPEHPDFTAMCDSKTAFLQRIIDTDCYTYALKYDTTKSIEKRAKAMRSRLFHPDSSFKLRPVGVPWYDELGKWIATTLKELDVETAHMFFTTHEQRIINTAFEVVGRDNIILRMHDGFVADIISDELSQTLRDLKEATGYKWSASIYED